MKTGRVFGLSDHLSSCIMYDLEMARNPKNSSFQACISSISCVYRALRPKIRRMMRIIFSAPTQRSSSAAVIQCNGQVIYCNGYLLQQSSAATVVCSHYIYMGSRLLIFLSFKWKKAFSWLKKTLQQSCSCRCGNNLPHCYRYGFALLSAATPLAFYGGGTVKPTLEDHSFWLSH